MQNRESIFLASILVFVAFSSTLIMTTMQETVYRLVSTLELDLTLGDDVIPTRVEIFRSSARPMIFRARIWQLESCRTQASFPQDEKTGEPTQDPADEDMLIERTWLTDRDFSNFEAGSIEEAEKQLLTALDQWLNQVRGEQS